jgi:hypothetical protein
MVPPPPKGAPAAVQELVLSILQIFGSVEILETPSTREI